MWFFYALCTTVMWGIADLFYKKSADGADRYSHLKTTVAVGVAMGLYATYQVTLGGVDFAPVNMLIYLPVSLMYILSMAIGYFGLKYLALSISSPIQNASGAVTAILCLIFLREVPDLVTGIAVCVISAGVFVLGLLEKKDESLPSGGERKYRTGIKAVVIPVVYCVIDALGTFFDAYYLDDIATTPLRHVTEENFEDVANVAYMYTFLIAAVVLFIYLRFVKKEKFSLPKQKNRIFAALAETAGQVTYVYVIGGMAVVAAPMISSYCIISLILSRIFLGEKLTVKQYITVAFIIAGIVALGVVDGLNGDV